MMGSPTSTHVLVVLHGERFDGGPLIREGRSCKGYGNNGVPNDSDAWPVEFLPHLHLPKAA